MSKFLKIVITEPEMIPAEAAKIERLLERGIDFVHIRKPGHPCAISKTLLKISLTFFAKGLSFTVILSLSMSLILEEYISTLAVLLPLPPLMPSLAHAMHWMNLRIATSLNT